jgi:hypothetical protein
MSDPLEGLGIPDALRRSGDPVDGNPYRDSDPLHPIWAEATRNAQRELHGFRSRIIAELPVRSEDFLDWLCRFFGGQFDVWAKRCKYVVWTDKAVDAYDDWLVRYADDLLRLIKDSEKLSFSTEPLRLRLIGRIEFWKSEARRYRAELESRVQQATPPEKLATTNDSIFWFSDDYRSVWFRDESHALTPNQAAMLRVLHQEHLAGHYSVSKDKLLLAIGNLTSQVRDSWKHSALWGTLVVIRRKSAYGLNLPPANIESIAAE